MTHAKLISIVSVAVAFLVACSDSAKDGGGKVTAGKVTEAEPDDCQIAGDRAAANMMAAMLPDTDPRMREGLEKMGRETGHMIAERCRADGWSVDAVTCGLTAKDPQIECRGKLTATQLKKMEDTVQEIWTEGFAEMAKRGPPR